METSVIPNEYSNFKYIVEIGDMTVYTDEDGKAQLQITNHPQLMSKRMVERIVNVIYKKGVNGNMPKVYTVSEWTSKCNFQTMLN